MHAFFSLFIVVSSDAAHIIGVNLWDWVHTDIQPLSSGHDAQRKVLYTSVFDIYKVKMLV